MNATFHRINTEYFDWIKRKLGAFLSNFLGTKSAQANAKDRDGSRDLDRADILWLLAAYTFVLAPHANRQPWWFTAIIIGVLIWRGLIATKAWRFPPSLLLHLVTLAAAVATWYVHGRLYGRDPGVMLLIAMLGLKLMEMKRSRDVTWAVYLGLFLVTTNFFYSQSVFMALYAFISLGLFVATMVGFARIASKPTLRERIKPALALMGFALPLALILFFLFPRIQGPLWRMPDQSRVGKTGLSDSMTPGNISELIKSEDLVFTVKFDGPSPSSSVMYWRGPVLTSFDGRTWRSDGFRLQQLRGDYAALTGGNKRGQKVSYTMTMEPADTPWITALDIPENIPEGLRSNQDFQMSLSFTNLDRTAQAAQRRNVKLSSFLQYQMEEPTGEPALARAKMLPRTGNLKARELATQWRVAAGTGPESNRKVMEEALRLYNREFTYTLEPPILQSQDTIDEFLFTTKLGFCEHYSGSFAFLMRAADIPARVVTGYLGGELNPYNQTVAVRQSEAHAWTEVYLPGEGWLRIDPTSAVAPSRIERGMNALAGQQGFFGNIEANDPLGIVAWTRLNWDAFNYQWTQWVINYNQDRQRDFLSNFGIDNANWETMAKWMVGLGVAVSGIVTLLMLARLRPRKKDALTRAIELLDKALAKRGVPRAASEGMESLAMRLQSDHNALWQQLDPLLRKIAHFRYSETASETDLAEIKSTLNKI